MQQSPRSPRPAPALDLASERESGARRRPLLAHHEAGELAGLFKLFASDTRLKLLHALSRTGELCVTELASEVGMKPQAVSNQLQRLVDRRVLGCSRRGTSVYYQIIDPCVAGLLEYGLCLNDDARMRSGTASASGARRRQRRPPGGRAGR